MGTLKRTAPIGSAFLWVDAGLAEAAYETIHGRFSDEQRQGVFKPAVAVADDASPQGRLLAYTGRRPG
jgi:hypothetical protein